MAKTAFKCIGILVVILVLAAAIGVYMILRIDPNQYIPEIQKQVDTQLDAKLELKSIEWKLWPSLQLELNDLALSTKAQDHAELVAVKNASVKVAVMPLLQKQVQVDHLTLAEPKIWYYADAKGNNNWQPLLDKLQSKEPETETTTSPDSSQDFNIAVDRVGITDGLLQVTGANQATISKLNLDVQNIQFVDPIPVDLKAHIKMQAPSPQEFDFAFNSNIKMNKTFEQIALNDMTTSLKGSKKDQNLTIKGNTAVNTKTMAIETDLSVAPLVVDSWVDLSEDSQAVNDSASQKTTTKTKSEPTPLPKDMLKDLNLQAKLNFEDIKVKGTSHQFALEGKAQKGYITLHDVDLNAYDGKAQGNIELNVNPNPAKLAVDMDIQKMAIGQILNTWAGSQPLTGNLSTKLNVETKGNTVEDLIAGLKGSTDVTMLQATLPKINLNELVWNGIQSKTGNLVEILNQFPKIKEQLGTLKTPKILRGETQLDQVLAAVKISPEQIQSQKINATLNDSPIVGQFSYGRLTEKLTLDTVLKLPFENKDLADISWPLSCSGTLEGKLSCGIDSAQLKPVLEKLAKNELKGRLREELAPQEAKAREELKKVEDEAKAKVEEKLGTSLKSIFKKEQ